MTQSKVMTIIVCPFYKDYIVLGENFGTFFSLITVYCSLLTEKSPLPHFSRSASASNNVDYEWVEGKQMNLENQELYNN